MAQGAAGWGGAGAAGGLLVAHAADLLCPGSPDHGRALLQRLGPFEVRLRRAKVQGRAGAHTVQVGGAVDSPSSVCGGERGPCGGDAACGRRAENWGANKAGCPGPPPPAGRQGGTRSGCCCERAHRLLLLAEIDVLEQLLRGVSWVVGGRHQDGNAGLRWSAIHACIAYEPVDPLEEGLCLRQLRPLSAPCLQLWSASTTAS